MSTIPSLATRRSLSLIEPLESRIAPANAFPTVLSIDRGTPTAEHTAATSVVFKVTFSEAVSGVDVTPSTAPDGAGIFGDFKVVTTGAAKTGAVTISSTDQIVYTVTVSGLHGNGDVRLDLVDNDSILGQNLNTGAPQGLAQLAAATVPLGGDGAGNGSFTGQAYHLLQEGPTVTSITRVGPAKSFSSTATWTVTFSEKVTGVDATDFFTNVSGGLAAPNALTVTAVGTAGTTYTVSTTGLTGTGNIQLVLHDDQTIKDVDGNLYQVRDMDFDDPQSTNTGRQPNAVAVGDLNADGKPDVVTANRASDFSGTNTFTVLLGNGDGTFTTQAVTGHFAQTRNGIAGIAIADVNGDGKPDLVVAEYNQSFTSNVSVLLGNGDGTFQPQQDVGFRGIPKAVTVDDMDGDGRPDIVLVTQGFSGQAFVNVLLGNGDGTFNAPSTIQTGDGATAVAVADVDGDGKPDVVTANDYSDTVSVLLGTGAGNLAPKVDYGGANDARSIALSDVNGDGRPDIVTGDSNDRYVNVLLNDPAHPGQFLPSNSFQTRRTYDITSVAVADFNGDGKPDIAAVGTYEDGDTYLQVRVLPGNGDGTFNRGDRFFLSFSYGPGHIAVADFNGDGKADLTVADADNSALKTRLNTEYDYSGDTITRGFAGWIVTTPGVAVGKKFAPPLVKEYDRASGELVQSFLAYEPTYRDSIRVAVGDFNGDGVDDIVTTTQHNGGRLRVFDGLTGLQFTKGPFASEIDVFTGAKNGAFVATGDVNGDGQLDIILGSSLGGGKVKILDGNDGSTLKEFTPFGDKFKGGVRVASGDVNGPTIRTIATGNGALPDIQAFDNAWPMDDLIVGMGYLGGQVKVYNGISDTVLGMFSVGKKGYRGGASVAAGDVNHDGKADLIVGRNSGKPSIVEIFDAATLHADGTLPTQIGKSINPFDKNPLKPTNIYGVRVATVDVNLDGIADIITSVGVKGSSQVKIYDGKAALDGTYTLISPDRSILAYPDYPDVALWIAGSRTAVVA